MNASPTTRRTLLKQVATVAASLAGGGLSRAAAERSAGKAAPSRALPWYRRTLRWGQTNITEIDPTRYDIAWWRQHWKRTQTQGVIINAGGIVAYYPSRVPLHRPAQHLGGRDLFGELCRAAHEDELVVFARMDSNRAHEDLYRAHPDWFAADIEGRPYQAGELFITCVNSPYYDEHIPAILREIVDRYRPEGFKDNSWSGLGRGSICYCDQCQRKLEMERGVVNRRMLVGLRHALLANALASDLGPAVESAAADVLKQVRDLWKQAPLAVPGSAWRQSLVDNGCARGGIGRRARFRF